MTLDLTRPNPISVPSDFTLGSCFAVLSSVLGEGLARVGIGEGLYLGQYAYRQGRDGVTAVLVHPAVYDVLQEEAPTFSTASSN